MSKDQKTCKFRGCKTHVKRGKWCAPHRKEVRKEQLRVNNVAWQARIAKGKAEHYLWYNDRPTDYALSSEARTEKAVQHAKELHPDWKIEDIRKMVAEAKRTRGAQVKGERSAKPAPKKVTVRKVAKTVKASGAKPSSAKPATPKKTKPPTKPKVEKVEIDPEKVDHSPKPGTFEAEAVH